MDTFWCGGHTGGRMDTLWWRNEAIVVYLGSYFLLEGLPYLSPSLRRPAFTRALATIQGKTKM